MLENGYIYVYMFKCDRHPPSTDRRTKRQSCADDVNDTRAIKSKVLCTRPTTMSGWKLRNHKVVLAKEINERERRIIFIIVHVKRSSGCCVSDPD